MSTREKKIVTFSKDTVPSSAERFIATVARKGGEVEATQHVITMTDGKNQAAVEINSVTTKGRDLQKAFLEQIVSELKEQFDVEVNFRIKNTYGDFESHCAFQTIDIKFNSKSSDSEDNYESTKGFRTKVKEALYQMQQKGIVENTDLKIEHNSQIISNTDTTLQVEHYSSNQDLKFIAPTEPQQDEAANSQDLAIATPYNGQNKLMQILKEPRTEDIDFFRNVFMQLIDQGEGILNLLQDSIFFKGKKQDYFSSYCMENDSQACDINKQIEQTMPTLADYKSAVLPYYTCKPLSLGAVKKVAHSDHPISQGDLILSRVYSDSHLDAEELFPYYVNDLSQNGDAPSRDVMNMISIWIAQGKAFPQKENNIPVTNWEKKIAVEIQVKNPLKFVYNLEHANCASLAETGRDALAYYHLVHNIVFTKSGMQKSLLAHELTHAAMDHLFDNGANPYPQSSDDAHVAGYHAAMKESLVKMWNKLSMPISNPQLMTVSDMVSQLLPNHPQSLLLILALNRNAEGLGESWNTLLSKKHLSELAGILQQCLNCSSNDNDDFNIATLFNLFEKMLKKADNNCFTYNEVMKLASTEGSEIKEAVDNFVERHELSADDLKVISVLTRLSAYSKGEFDREFIVLIPELHAKEVSDEAIEHYFASTLKFWQENISPVAQSMVEAHKAHCEKFFYDNEAEQCKNNVDLFAISNSNFAYCIAEIGQPEESFTY